MPFTYLNVHYQAQCLCGKTQTNNDLIISSLGTDGIDGNTKYAGAITKNIQVNPQKIKSYLQNNNSNSFFKKYGGLIKTGYTNTNLMDIGLILKLK